MHKVRSRTEELLQRRSTAVPRGVHSSAPIFVEWAEGARLRDIDGREYIDFAGGLGVLAVGHRHPAVTAALRAQMERYLHTCFHVAMYEPYIALAERLNALAPGSFAKKTMFANSGAEAVARQAGHDGRAPRVLRARSAHPQVGGARQRSPLPGSARDLRR